MTVRTKSDAVRVLADYTEDKSFFCQDGRVVKNLAELAACLTQISQDAFYHHVSDTKNDFSTWIRDVIGDKKLVDTLLGIKNPAEAAKIVSERIAWLHKKLNQVN